MKKFVTLLGLLTTMEAYAMENKSYVLQTGEKAADRLNKQSDLIKAATFEHLDKAGLAAGQTVVDMGCGSGVMTAYLAEKVGPKGHVYAVDISEDQLNVVRKLMAEKKFTNVSYLRADLEDESAADLAKIKGLADLVYIRYVLMHLKNPDTAVKNLMSLIKEKGCVASQESLLSSTHTEPACQEICDEYAMHIALGAKLGTDKNIGAKLKPLYEKAGFAHNDYYTVTHKLPMKEASVVMLKSLEEGMPSVLENKMSTPEKLNIYKAVLTRLGQENNRTLVFDQGYIIARK